MKYPSKSARKYFGKPFRLALWRRASRKLLLVELVPWAVYRDTEYSENRALFPIPFRYQIWVLNEVHDSIPTYLQKISPDFRTQEGAERFGQDLVEAEKVMSS